MAITLTSKQERLVRHVAKLRGMDSAENYFEKLLNKTLNMELFFAENHEDINASIEEAWQEMERGEFYTPEQVKADLAKAKAEFSLKRSAA